MSEKNQHKGNNLNRQWENNVITDIIISYLICNIPLIKPVYS